MKGRIINVNKEKRYGFIRTQNNNQGDVYFTLSSFKVKMDKLYTLRLLLGLMGENKQKI